MQIVCISRGTYSGGQQLAEKLAEKLGYACLSREKLIEAATREGIQVGKLETAMMKPHLFSERLALEKEHYLAFTTAYLLEQALQGGLIYHGRTGHLLLPGIAHVLRVRVIADSEYRIRAAMARLGVDRAKARRYLEEVEGDIRRWVHAMYGVSWEDAAHYDMIVNLEQLSVENAAAALTSVAQLPDFQMTPASRKAMENMLLSAKARMLLAQDERTRKVSFKVRVDNGVITVTYLPHDAPFAKVIPAVLEKIAGSREVRTTMAATNILWIQEAFDYMSETFKQVVEIATKWNAAVELLQLTPEQNGGALEQNGSVEAAALPTARVPLSEEYDGGIEDEVVEPGPKANDGMKQTLDELAKLGLSGGGKIVTGGQERLLSSVDRTIPYTLVVIGEVFLSKGQAARLRLSRELRSFLSDQIKAPVVTIDELKMRFLFTQRDLLRLLGFFGPVLLVYLLIFTNQTAVLQFLSGEGWKAKLISALAVLLVVPSVAYLYGNLSKTFFKLIKME